MRSKAAIILLTGLLATAVVVLPAAASANASAAPRESHCVLRASAPGPTKAAQPICFDTQSEAMRVAGLAPELQDDPHAAVRSVRHAIQSHGERAQGAPSSRSFARDADVVLGVHYSGTGLSGSSITVMGDMCGGSWVQLPPVWIDQISSTLNGCYEVIHYAGDMLTGVSETLFGYGGNLLTLDDATNSLEYWG